MFDTVLIANRGEIAVRVGATLRRLGIRTVAVYSDADAGARHVQDADLAVRIGPAAARDSYLSIERVVDAALTTGAQAVHPGYGFLSENADFAAALDGAGIMLIGPPVHALHVMGDKIRAKAAVQAAGVPVVPGGTGTTDAELAAAAEAVGFPVLVKPSAGGGGKGMRVVEDASELEAALASARREAAASFGDDTLLLERYVQRPRHIEVQVMADSYGTVLHLGERECSLQRRHQKVVEEAPSPLLNETQRAAYGALAVATARAVGYQGAGTVELIVAGDAPDEPFFLEMNTRLQVEHPVTELVTGLDLVELQLRVAAGERLPFAQPDVRLGGHAVEARVYAEDPARGFLPTGGRVLRLREPAGEGVRVDSMLLTGLTVGTDYDPMLAKVIAHGPDRATALARLDRALASTVVLGVPTNIAFLRGLLGHPDVRAGTLDTGLIERLPPFTAEVPVVALAAYALTRRLALRGEDPWTALVGWRALADAPLRLDVLAPDRVRLELVGDRLRVRGREHVVAAQPVDGGLLVTLDGQSLPVLTAEDGGTLWVAAEAGTFAVREAPPVPLKAGAGTVETEVRSPMPGAVVAVGTAGAVEAGAVLVVVEAMKMEHALRAPVAGTAELRVRVGDQVVVDQVLARVEPAG